MSARVLTFGLRRKVHAAVVPPDGGGYDELVARAKLLDNLGDTYRMGVLADLADTFLAMHGVREAVLRREALGAYLRQHEARGTQ